MGRPLDIHEIRHDKIRDDGHLSCTDPKAWRSRLRGELYEMRLQAVRSHSEKSSNRRLEGWKDMRLMCEP